MSRKNAQTNSSAASAKKPVATAWFAAYLLLAIPYNNAMGADANWQTPQVAPVVAPAPIAPGTAPVANNNGAKLFQITKDDVGAAVAQQLQLQGVEKKATANIVPFEGNVFYSADHPLELVIHGLQIDAAAHRWQAQANILSNHQTEIVKPISGFYEGVTTVPVLSKTTSRGDVIAATDLTTLDVPDRSLRKDTITDAQSLIGKSPRAQISPNRPIRTSELSNPIVIHRGEPVEMTYTAPYMDLKTTGIALEDGELGGMLRVKNSKSEKAVTARATGPGKVEANLDATP